MKKMFFLAMFALTCQAAIAAPVVPERMQFCGMELSINAEARLKIEETVTKIQRYASSYQAMVDRANILFPFIEEAFDLRAVPQDLKYIVIQESSMNADAVSSSNAVGYWQFKEESARESGITIDEYVDERKHIFQSSLGAAKYFYSVARLYDNYLYAVIGYNRGPVGALPFTDDRDYGRKTMEVTGQTHWYAIKALAHKLAFEDALGKTEPQTWLQPMNTHGETDVKKLAEAQGLTFEEFKKYNSWIKGDKLPAGKDFIYYLPRKGKPEWALMRHIGGAGSGKQIGENPPIVMLRPAIEKPKPAQTNPIARDTRKFDYLEPTDDLAYGAEYVRVQQGESLAEIAVHHQTTAKKLQTYNGFTNYHRPAAGDIVYLKQPQARKFHIVQAGESLTAIAEIYESTPEKLRAKNRSTGNVVFAGQKLSLKKRVSKGQKPTLLAVPNAVDIIETEIEEVKETITEPTETKRPKIVSNAGDGILTIDPLSYRLPAFESKVVTHTVGSNESLWKISKKYGCYADVIKKMNGLTSSEVKQGQQLKVLQITDRL